MESSRSLSINTQIGTKNYLHCTGVGKCILAYMPEDEQQHILAGPLKALTFNTIVDPRQLQAELRHIRADGYAMDNEEVEVGLSCVAVPVFSAPGQGSCSISISGMTPRVRTAQRGGLLDDLRQASADISRSLYGYQPADDLLYRVLRSNCIPIVSQSGGETWFPPPLSFVSVPHSRRQITHGRIHSLLPQFFNSRSRRRRWAGSRR